MGTGETIIFMTLVKKVGKHERKGVVQMEAWFGLSVPSNRIRLFCLPCWWVWILLKIFGFWVLSCLPLFQEGTTEEFPALSRSHNCPCCVMPLVLRKRISYTFEYALAGVISCLWSSWSIILESVKKPNLRRALATTTNRDKLHKFLAKLVKYNGPSGLRWKLRVLNRFIKLLRQLF